VASLIPAIGHAQSDAVDRTNRAAYEAAIKCFVVDGYASTQREKAGDAEKAASYEASARHSFDVAFAAGARIGLGDSQVNRDIDYAQVSELPKLIRDLDYLKSVAATCKALHLM